MCSKVEATGKGGRENVDVQKKIVSGHDVIGLS
jgi:hypothetical protein